MKKGKNTLNVFSVLILIICIIFSSACAPETAVEDNSASNIPENEAQTSSAVLTSQTTKEQATVVTSAVNAVKMNNASTAKQSSTAEGKAQPSTTKAQPSTTKARLVTIKARPSTTKASTTAKATEKSTSTTVSEKADTSNKQTTKQTVVGYIASGMVGLARNMLGIESKPKQSTATETTTTTKPQLPSRQKSKMFPISIRLISVIPWAAKQYREPWCLNSGDTMSPLLRWLRLFPEEKQNIRLTECGMRLTRL